MSQNLEGRYVREDHVFESLSVPSNGDLAKRSSVFQQQDGRDKLTYLVSIGCSAIACDRASCGENGGSKGSIVINDV